MSTDIATTDPAALPAIPNTPKPVFQAPGASGLVPPRITLAQGQSEFVTQREYDVKNGDVIWHNDKTGIIHLIGGDAQDDSFIGFVVGSDLRHFNYSDGVMTPCEPHECVPGSDNWETWFFKVAIPGIDDLLPARLQMTRSNLPAAAQINTAVARFFNAQGLDVYSGKDAAVPVPVRFKVVGGTGRGGHQFYKFVCNGLSLDKVDMQDYQAAKTILETSIAIEANRAAETRAPQVDDKDLPSI